MKTFVEQLAAEVVAHTGVTIIQTADEERLLRKCRQVAKEQERVLWSWSLSRGLRCCTDPGLSEPKVQEVAQLFVALLQWQAGPAIVVAHDLVSWINHPEAEGPITARLIRDVVQQQTQLNEAGVQGDHPTDGPQAPSGPEDPANGIMQLVVCDSEELRRSCGASVVTLELPDRAETEELLDGFLEPREMDLEPRDQVVQALAGLPGHQQLQAVQLAYASGSLDPQFIQDYKQKALQARGITWLDPEPQGFDRIGGLEPLKQWLRQRALTFNHEKAVEYDVRPARGVIVAGVPGNGKSLLARSIATVFGEVATGAQGNGAPLPLLQANIGATRGKFHGQSERWFQELLDTAATVAGGIGGTGTSRGRGAILFIDEAEKMFSGSGGSGDLDSGVAARVMGQLLTWLQNRPDDAPVFLYMTANRPHLLPVEIGRAGRFDGTFWINAPGTSGRREIIEIYKSRYRKVIAVDTETLVRASDGNTGAEIEQAFLESAIQAMAKGNPRITTTEVVAQLAKLPKTTDTFVVGPELARWRDTAMRANNQHPDDLSGLEETTDNDSSDGYRQTSMDDKPLLN